MSINTQNNFPGICSLFSFDKGAGIPMSQLFQACLRDVDESERIHLEAICGLLGYDHNCSYTYVFHRAMLSNYIGEELTSRLFSDMDLTVVDKLPETYNLATVVVSGNTDEIEKQTAICKEKLNEREVHNVILVCSACMMEINYLKGCGLQNPDMNYEEYLKLAKSVVADGYPSLVN